MFKNRALQVKMVRTDATEETSEERVPRPYEDPELMNQIAKDFVREVAIVVGAVIVVSFGAAAIKEIIVHAATK
jgi:hypothetical protein